MDRKEIRKHFNDFRYLNSTEHPDVFKEYVRYDDVVRLVEEIEQERDMVRQEP